MSAGLDIRSAHEVSQRNVEMFGSDLLSSPGVIHVAAVAGAGGEGRVLKIGPETPTSPYDAFVLSVTRARADCIVTTGRILRDEPNLTHAYLGDEGTRNALSTWRRAFMHKPDPPGVLVLTSGKDLDPTHPVFAGPRRTTIVTSREGEASLRARGFDAADIVSLAEPSIRNLIPYVMRDTGVATISVEAGPSTSATMYTHPLIVDELVLSTFSGSVSRALLGGSFLSEVDKRNLFCITASYSVNSPEGSWSFTRYVRRAKNKRRLT